MLNENAVRDLQAKIIMIYLIIALTIIGGFIYAGYKIMSNDSDLDLNPKTSFENSMIVSEDKLRVDYFFWLKCGACNQVEPYVADFHKKLGSEIDFNFIPIGWGNAINDAKPYYIIKKLLDEGKINKDEYLKSIVGLFDITFKDKAQLTNKNIFNKLFTSKTIFKDVSEFSKYVDESNGYIEDGLAFSKYATEKYGVGGVPFFLIDASKGASLSDFGGDPVTLLNELEKLSKQKKK